jgi:hypothetical protein
MGPRQEQNKYEFEFFAQICRWRFFVAITLAAAGIPEKLEHRGQSRGMAAGKEKRQSAWSDSPERFAATVVSPAVY